MFIECLLHERHWRHSSGRKSEQTPCLHEACILVGRGHREKKETYRICGVLECDAHQGEKGRAQMALRPSHHHLLTSDGVGSPEHTIWRPGWNTVIIPTISFKICATRTWLFYNYRTQRKSRTEKLKSALTRSSKKIIWLHPSFSRRDWNPVQEFVTLAS